MIKMGNIYFLLMHNGSQWYALIWGEMFLFCEIKSSSIHQSPFHICIKNFIPHFKHLGEKETVLQLPKVIGLQ